MPGQLDHSPADVVRQLLIDLGLGTAISTAGAPTGAWPVYHASAPPEPDRIITVRSTTGIDGGRSHPDGERLTHHGIQVAIRSVSESEGYIKANAIAIALDQSVRRVTVTVDGVNYLVYCFSKVGDVIPAGKETPTSKRSLFTINPMVSLRKVT